MERQLARLMQHCTQGHRTAHHGTPRYTAVHCPDCRVLHIACRRNAPLFSMQMHPQSSTQPPQKMKNMMANRAQSPAFFPLLKNSSRNSCCAMSCPITPPPIIFTVPPVAEQKHRTTAKKPYSRIDWLHPVCKEIQCTVQYPLGTLRRVTFQRKGTVPTVPHRKTLCPVSALSALSALRRLQYKKVRYPAVAKHDPTCNVSRVKIVPCYRFTLHASLSILYRWYRTGTLRRVPLLRHTTSSVLYCQSQSKKCSSCSNIYTVPSYRSTPACNMMQKPCTASNPSRMPRSVSL